MAEFIQIHRGGKVIFYEGYTNPPDQASNKAEKLASSMRKRAQEEIVSILRIDDAL